MATRKALGRGLAALIPPSEKRQTLDPALADEPGGPLHIAVERIVPNPRQPRKSFGEAELNQLAGSIREQGILQPLVVRRRGDGYELIIGERRWRAAQRAGLTEVPAVILDASDRAVIELALVENVQRADLNALELAQAFAVLVNEEGMTQEQVGKRVGLDRSTVANHLRLNELPETIQQDLIEGRLTMGHAKAILQAPDEQRAILRDRILRSGLSVRAAEDLSRRVASARHYPRSGARTVRDVHLVDLEGRLQREMQTRVRIIGKPERGRIEIHYYSGDELGRLAVRLGGAES
ncbi:MAG: ParB/RepB/Spo0J family partition protein [Myxococcota bacterium]